MVMLEKKRKKKPKILKLRYYNVHHIKGTLQRTKHALSGFLETLWLIVHPLINLV